MGLLVAIAALILFAYAPGIFVMAVCAFILISNGRSPW